jgi:transposase InsO family protein
MNPDNSAGKVAFARQVRVSRSMLYYQHRLPAKDWRLKQRILEVLRTHPAYGHKRIALELNVNKKRTLRVMRIFGIKPFRRRGRKWRKAKENSTFYPNLLLTELPSPTNTIWVSDFTPIPFHSRFLHLATVMDLFSREIVGFSVLLNHSAQLVINALLCAVNHHAPPNIIHSDQGSEYTGKDYLTIVKRLGISVSMSAKASPWENGYQESFYSQFKVDLGDPNRFATVGELVLAVYHTIYGYNHTRIHTKLKMPPAIFAQRQLERSNLINQKVLERVS